MTASLKAKAWQGAPGTTTEHPAARRGLGGSRARPRAIASDCPLAGHEGRTLLKKWTESEETWRRVRCRMKSLPSLRYVSGCTARRQSDGGVTAH